MYMSWVYHGTSGLRNLVEGAFDTATHLLEIIKQSPDLSIVSPDPLPCTQVCLYYTPAGRRVGEEETSKITQTIAKELVNEGFLIDYAPGPHGKMLRIVVGVYTERSTVERLASSIVEIGKRIS
jgi:glutamate decarboxylase